jgi:hypothetical protein
MKNQRITIYFYLLLGDQNVGGMHVFFLFFKTDSYGRSWRKLKKVGHSTELESYR